MFPERVTLDKARRWLTVAFRPASQPSYDKGSVAFDARRAMDETNAKCRLLEAFRNGEITSTGRHAVPVVIDTLPARAWSTKPSPPAPIPVTEWPEGTDDPTLNWTASQLVNSDDVYLDITISFAELRALRPGAIDDNPFDLTLAEAISYLAFGLVLTKEGLKARRKLSGEPRSEEDDARVNEILDRQGPGEEMPKNLTSEEEKKWREKEARKTRLLGAADLDFMSSLEGRWPVFSPDDQVKIDGAQDRLVRWWIDGEVTGTGIPQIDDEKIGEARETIPPSYLRSEPRVEPLTDTTYENILLDGNFGRPLKRYWHVQINRAELKAAAGDGQPAFDGKAAPAQEEPSAQPEGDETTGATIADRAGDDLVSAESAPHNDAANPATPDEHGTAPKKGHVGNPAFVRGPYYKKLEKRLESQARVLKKPGDNLSDWFNGMNRRQFREAVEPALNDADLPTDRTLYDAGKKIVAEIENRRLFD